MAEKNLNKMSAPATAKTKNIQQLRANFDKYFKMVQNGQTFKVQEMPGTFFLMQHPNIYALV